MQGQASDKANFRDFEGLVASTKWTTLKSTEFNDFVCFEGFGVSG